MSILKTYVQDLESDAFDAEEYVERLAWRLTEDTEGPLDASYLHSALEEEIGNLQILSDQCQAKIEGLENNCREEEEEYYVSLERLLAEHESAEKKLKCLNERINAVAVRVVHLGDQLQSLSTPRARAHEALQLVQHFTDFLNDHAVVSDVFSDPDKLLEAGDIIYKLNMIAQELPAEKFGKVRKRISDKYDEVEMMLIDLFSRSHLAGNKAKIKEIATVLSQFKVWRCCLSICLNLHVQMKSISGLFSLYRQQAFHGSDIFADVLALCTSKCEFISEVFPTPQRIMAKLILNIFHGKLQEYISKRLKSKENDAEGRLNDLFELYSKTKTLVNELLKINLMASEKEFLWTLVRALFTKYLHSYIKYVFISQLLIFAWILAVYSLETGYLNEQCAFILQKFYASTGHQKKSVPTSGLQEFKRDLQARLMPENYGNETLLSEEVAISILQETKNAFQRCQTVRIHLSSPGEVTSNLQQLVDILIRYLCREHIEYAVDLAANSVQTETQCCNFLRVVRQTAAIFHLFEKQFEDSILPLFR
ncbi:unnamed protein product [Soboliphyme baturini]|uniref:Exocyst complex component 5 n=1 Tax=Soboliphyme baturini TaxID=241478 RepID=A0A183IW09_9BILA|nr:unnamed protein product [Soboliphyme baturini]